MRVSEHGACLIEDKEAARYFPALERGQTWVIPIMVPNSWKVSLSFTSMFALE